MNTFQLQCFLAVAETLNFARAGELLNITQPAVTHQIKSLETELGTQLFKRSTHAISMTPAAFVFLEDARLMVGISERAKKRFSSKKQVALLPLTIGCHSLWQRNFLADILRALREEYPNFHPQLKMIPFQHLHQLLADGEIDSIVGFKDPNEKKSRVVFRELVKVPYTCFLAKDNPLAKKESLSAEDIKNLRLVRLFPGKIPFSVEKYFRTMELENEPIDTYFCESVEAMLLLAKAGFGAAVIPALSTENTEGLAAIPAPDIPPASFGLYYRKQKNNEILHAFVRKATEHFTSSQ